MPLYLKKTTARSANTVQEADLGMRVMIDVLSGNLSLSYASCAGVNRGLLMAANDGESLTKNEYNLKRKTGKGADNSRQIQLPSDLITSMQPIITTSGH